MMLFNRVSRFNFWFIIIVWLLKKNYTNKVFSCTVILLRRILLNTCKLVLFKLFLYHKRHKILIILTTWLTSRHMYRKPVKWGHTHGFPMGMTSLWCLYYLVGTFVSWRDVQLSRVKENQFYLIFYNKMQRWFWIKPTKMTSVHSNSSFKVYSLSQK